jgi:hypothetical protein
LHVAGVELVQVYLHDQRLGTGIGIEHGSGERVISRSKHVDGAHQVHGVVRTV